MHIAEDEDFTLEEWCEENGVVPAGEEQPVSEFANEEEWLASLPPEVAEEIRQQLNKIEAEYKEAARRLFEQK